MNETDEFILDAFKQQGLANDELVEELRAEVAALPDSEVVDQDVSLMDALLERTGMPKQEIINYMQALGKDKIDELVKKCKF